MNKCGLYIHIPFCNKICSYCDFTKRVSNYFTKEKYLNYLLKEITLYEKNGFDFSKITSVYIGGGTPSALDVKLLKRLFDKLNNILDFSKIIEFTFEFNPEDLNHEIIDLLVSYNVNRVSIGIQTLEKSLLKTLNRDFDFERFLENYKYLKTRIDNINFDVMYAIPGQTVNMLEDTIIRLIDLSPTHFSVYSLILEEKTIFYKKYLNEEIKMVNEDLELLMVNKIHELLDLQYPQYEVSNYSNLHESYHNLLYWHNLQYLGIGLSAASYIGYRRYQNTKKLHNYFDNIDNGKFPVDYVEELSIFDTKKHHIIQGFRLVKGINVNEYFSRYKSSIFDDFPRLLEFVNNGYFEFIDSSIRISKEYFYVMDYFIEKLM